MTASKPSLIDTHAHLTFKDFDTEIDAVIKRAFDVGLCAIINIGSGDDIKGNQKALDLAEKYENIFVALGVHPNDAANVDIDEAVKVVRDLAGNKKVVAIGEIGLDYYRGKESAAVQKKCFRKFLELAFELKLPVSIHVRDAHEDALKILEEMKGRLMGGVFHCYSGDTALAKKLIEMGFLISIPGIITFKNAKLLREVVLAIGVEKLVIETDCPFLAPEPYRGKRNEPSYVKLVAEELAKITGLTFEDVARITTRNARVVFGLPSEEISAEIAYPIRKSLYINLTNRCTLACTFCPKQKGSFDVKGHHLKLTKEPDVEAVFRAVGDVAGYDEIVFCGFGESTMRIEVLKVVAAELKKRGKRVRLDTDGLGCLVHGRDILPELGGLIDAVSVSMNAPDAKTYMKICPSKYGEEAFFAMLSFLERAKQFIPDVTASVVGLPGIDIEACKKLAGDLGVKFRLRKFEEIG